MFKRLMIGLVAVGLVTIFIAEVAHARASRLRRTVENIHSCKQYLPGTTTPDLCYGATSVTDTLYGVNEETGEAICTMLGRVICDAPPGEELCSQGEEPAALDALSFSATATFDLTDATNETLLSEADGKLVCDATYGEGTKFINYWPYRFKVRSIYIGTSFPNLPPNTVTYELIEDCVLQYDENDVPLDEYVCTKEWDSSPASLGTERPYLPCCGEQNTITVEIPGGGGVVTSDPSGIDCPGDCDETYGTGEAGSDGCPPVELTVTPDSAFIYDFTGWSGGGCSGTDLTCTTFAKDSPTVTATFVPKYEFFLKVEVVGDGKKDYGYIWDPRLDFDDPAEKYCTGTCYKIFEEGTVVTIKRKGGKFGSWGGACDGVPNSADQCTITIDGTQDSVIVNFVN